MSPRLWQIYIGHLSSLFDFFSQQTTAEKMRFKRERLIKAASKGHFEAFKKLLQPDASFSLQEAEFTLEKLAGIAARHRHSKIFKFCIGLGANVNDEAIRTGVLQFNRLSVYKKVIAAGFDLQYDHDGTIGGPLIWATLANHIPLAMYLLEHGVDANCDLQSGVYRPLAKAAENNSVAMLELLIAYGAQIDRSGALIVAAENGNLEAVGCLVSHGANINLMRASDTDLYTKPLEEQSALHKAVIGGHVDVVAFLVENGAELSLGDREGKDALIMAVETNNAEVFQIIHDARERYRLAGGFAV